MNFPHSVGLWRNDAHEYWWADGTGPTIGPLTSVTTAIKAVDKSGPLVGWAQRETAAAAVKHHAAITAHLEHRLPDPTCPQCSSVREWKGPENAAVNWLKKMPGYQKDAAADLGTRVHILSEKASRLETADLRDDEAPFVAAYERFRSDWNPEYLRVEAMVCNLTHAYAGTLDLLAALDGEVYLIDIKTGSGAYPEAALQLAALGHAEFAGWPEDERKHRLPKVDRYAVLHLRPELYPDTGYRLIPYAVTPETFQRFLEAKRMWEWLQNDAKKVMGKPLEQKELVAA